MASNYYTSAPNYLSASINYFASSITINRTGYKPQTIENINVKLGQASTVNIELETA